MKKIKVRYFMDRMGYLHMRPMSEVVQRRIRRHLKDFNVRWDGDVLVQEDYNVESALEDFTPGQRRDLEAGWDVTRLEDPWTWLHWVGWDAHEGVRA